MVWTAWNNGGHLASGAGYGFKLDGADRDLHFSPDWESVQIRLPEHDGYSVAVVNVDKKSFWGARCREVISRDIGKWLNDQGHAPWPKGNPPRFEVRGRGEPVFEIVRRV
ncbi:MAG: hypothetical protein HOP14_12460 [Acidobacteria bacterium]|nr:hypothetical protein [Acidobacteriota bacterium]